ncbi:protein adenylyltransferase SelO family protein [Guyparkeria hydrothermalis]|uniref:protein adenylyltransferase SelO n=1 Tax=Guyparkeria hydrothermalis TaxID=923 RepID=UPI002020C358|nr:protein adenylyltransferase SelO family protein [Guyparkeria hydrothermalis]MCL7751438.1 protein adenylyltransferase SelO family protein [Guyparkeria hydrothermalis]
MSNDPTQQEHQRDNWGHSPETPPAISSLEALAHVVDYSLMDSLNRDPEATSDGNDHAPRQVFSGHYVPVRPTPLENPEYVAHGRALFRELGFDERLARSDEFVRLFSGDLSVVPETMSRVGWACGYALSIYGTEFDRQCPFQTGNGYGDGRAISVLEVVTRGQRWEMQLKGAGRTPYCRGADGRAVLRSSVREFLAQEHMHALGVPTSRSLSLTVSTTETVDRPWYSEGSEAMNPDILVREPVAISTRVAPSFIRVGQLELFSRRARKQAHPGAKEELEALVLHLIEREYAEDVDQDAGLGEQILALAHAFRDRLTSLVADWIRVGYCQGNFNSDNCAAGGFTLDYGPFGFCEVFDLHFQPWTGGGRHFCFSNQPAAAERNFRTFCTTLRPLVDDAPEAIAQLDAIEGDFAKIMGEKLERMWARKLGLASVNAELFVELQTLMTTTPVDYTLFFRELSAVPDSIEPLTKSFYADLGASNTPASEDTQATEERWSEWLTKWRGLIGVDDDTQSATELARRRDEISKAMKRVNPKYTLREWFLVPAYQQAAAGDYSAIRELQEVMTQPYAEQSKAIEEKYYRLKPSSLFHVGGVSHYSCSS